MYVATGSQAKSRLPADYEAQLKRLPALRANCPACEGNAERCQQGQPDHNRLYGCSAFADDGNVRPVRTTPRQPWETHRAA